MNVAFFLTPKSLTAYLSTGDSIRQGLEKLKFHGYTALPVITPSGEYAGYISEGDFLREVLRVGTIDTRDLEDITIDKMIHTDNVAVKITATMDDLLSRILDHNFVPVTDDTGAFIGIVTRRAVIKHLASKIK